MNSQMSVGPGTDLRHLPLQFYEDTEKFECNSFFALMSDGPVTTSYDFKYLLLGFITFLYEFVYMGRCFFVALLI